jgi:hypothetical protein
LVAARYALQRKLVVKSMANEKDGPVGYKRPPVAHQFKPGVSGNPSGRPKSVRSIKAHLAAYLLEELAEVIRVREGDGELEIPKGRAMLRSGANAAAGGDMRALSTLLSFAVRIAGDTNELQGQAAEPEDAEILKNYTDRELRRRTDGGDANTDSSQIDPNQTGSEDHEK